MLRASLLFLVAVAGCAGAEMEPLSQGTRAPEAAASFESLAGSAGKTSVEGRSVGEHARRIIYTGQRRHRRRGIRSRAEKNCRTC